MSRQNFNYINNFGVLFINSCLIKFLQPLKITLFPVFFNIDNLDSKEFTDVWFFTTKKEADEFIENKYPYESTAPEYSVFLCREQKGWKFSYTVYNNPTFYEPPNSENIESKNRFGRSLDAFEGLLKHITNDILRNIADLCFEDLNNE